MVQADSACQNGTSSCSKEKKNSQGHIENEESCVDGKDEQKGNFDKNLDEKYSIIANASVVGEQNESFANEDKAKRCQSEGVSEENVDNEMKNLEKQKSVKDLQEEKIENGEFKDPKKLPVLNQKAEDKNDHQSQPCTPEKTQNGSQK